MNISKITTNILYIPFARAMTFVGEDSEGLLWRAFVNGGPPSPLDLLTPLTIRIKEECDKGIWG